MKIESITLHNFRCFGPKPLTVRLAHGMTALVGANGAGKTALMHALRRMFGVTEEQRRLVRGDFHVPAGEATPPTRRSLAIEVILAFPELEDAASSTAAVPQFFHHMAADEGGVLKCRLRLEAAWEEDGTAEGAIEAKLLAIGTLAPEYSADDCRDVSPRDRGRIQVVYVPATRDAASQVNALVRGRLWRAVEWSRNTRDALAEAGRVLEAAFTGEPAVAAITEAVTKRWHEVHGGGTFATPAFRPIDQRFEEFVRKVEVLFRPDGAGLERGLDSLSDGQRSLFHIAVTAATLDVEAGLRRAGSGFRADDIALPVLTILLLEEPENCLSPFYLSRIVGQLQELAGTQAAQAVVSSHSAGILGRVRPEDVRHFRLDTATRCAAVNEIRLPPDADEAGKFVREAVHAYPELYFARFVILGEGSSEQIVLPRIADAMGLHIDRSFVAVVPLGGRHVNHLWRLLNDLEIPHATLLDLDFGRDGGGWGRIHTACAQLIKYGHAPEQVLGVAAKEAEAKLAEIAAGPPDLASLRGWIDHLRALGVFFSEPLDIDLSMLRAFPPQYRRPAEGGRGPQGDAAKAKETTLGQDGRADLYDPSYDDDFRWYRYLFLGRGKPTTHLRALGDIDARSLANTAPVEIKALLEHVARSIAPIPPQDGER
ncbi:ATP-dependent nuclease [Azospirillum halopraeferens]|uniref:ATP-dependent nuclease n=1 Tax=Azospirillum halopraeferens TaxID=34010 RepID=UPI00041580D2|nr:AAA family ATPase [Azospirillum halopraeferens]